MNKKPKRPPMVERMKKRLHSNPKVNLVDMNIPLENGTDAPKLKDVLEEGVDEKYYLRNEIVERILKLASVDNQTRKKHVKDKTTPEVDICVEEGQCIATRHLGRNGKLVSDISSTIQVAETPHVIAEEEKLIRIRKLTPLECERLQGYSDNHTAKGINDKGEIVDISNSQRYKMCGNGISSPVPQTLFPTVFGNERIRVMSLFSGCGGTELLLPDNFKVVGHCEFDKYASSVLKYHYPDIPNFHDVTKFADRDDIPEFDMLVGGFPCPSWSAAGLRKGFDDLRGQLIFDVFKIIEKYRTPMIALENVKGLLSHAKGNSFEIIMERLSEIGYDLDFEVVNSNFFGLAQNRERVFIFGSRKMNKKLQVLELLGGLK